MIHPRIHSLYRSGSDAALTTAQRDVSRLGEMLATGKRVNRASDDAAAYAKARALDALDARNTTYTRSAEGGLSWLGHTQTALDNLIDLFATAVEAGIQGVNDTTSADDRALLANKIDNLLAASLDELNTQVDGEYLFAGTATQLPAGAKPFEMVAGVQVYNGNGSARDRQIGPNVTAPTSIPGTLLTATPQGGALLESLQGLSDALRDTTGTLVPSDALARVQEAHTHLAHTGAEAGERARRLDLALEQLRDARLPLEQERSMAEDTDFLDASSRMQDAQTRLQAALKVTASLKQMSLLDYL